MSISNLPTNKLVSLALQGYNPFQVDSGIFCGGYQGPLYPNPTTLVYPGLNPYWFLNPIMSVYMPESFEQWSEYYGLGVGDPGIDYKNPGHILGLMDTFSRMSYGIAILQKIYNGIDSNGDLAPVLNIAVPMLSNSGVTTLGNADIYPTMTESPAKWIDGFSINSTGVLSPDPRPLVSFGTVAKYIPAITPADAVILNGLFSGKTVFSYYNMPQYFRNVINALYLGASIISTKVDETFTIPTAKTFNAYAHPLVFNYFPDTGPGSIFDITECIVNEAGNYILHGKTLSPSQALRTLTGSTDYHDGPNGLNEYRSLTELNSVINLVPIQTVGGQYYSEQIISVQEYSPETGTTYTIYDMSNRTFQVASYLMTDLIINVSDVPVDAEIPGEITIEGTVTVKSIVSTPTAYYVTVEDGSADPSNYTLRTITYGCSQRSRKSVDLAMHITNKFAWDKSWIGFGDPSEGLEPVGLQEDSFNLSDTKYEYNNGVGGDSETGFNTIDESDLVMPFSQVFSLAPGCNSIRMRVLVRNLYTLAQTPNSYGEIRPDYWDPYEMEVWVPPTIPPIYITVYPGGTHSMTYENANGVIAGLVKDNIHLSFSVTGTNFDPISYNITL